MERAGRDALCAGLLGGLGLAQDGCDEIVDVGPVELLPLEVGERLRRAEGRARVISRRHRHQWQSERTWSGGQTEERSALRDEKVSVGGWIERLLVHVEDVEALLLWILEISNLRRKELVQGRAVTGAVGGVGGLALKLVPRLQSEPRGAQVRRL